MLRLVTKKTELGRLSGLRNKRFISSFGILDVSNGTDFIGLKSIAEKEGRDSESLERRC